ncbi:MAG TPA: hypothetical protein VJK07_00200 [Candidatus Nanoarchaeia archaeon]|nr:hypothetical protein [Candidatus Nanoarchaeia archaeon]
MPTTDEILRKYGSKIEAEINSYQPSQNYSQEYLDFKSDMLSEASRYQRWCEALGNIIRLRVSPKENIKLQNYLTAAHVEVTPAQSVTLATISFLLAFLLTALITAAVYFITQKLQLIFFVLGLITSVFLFYYVYSIPRRLANIWRLKASAQMVPAILYVVIYMKHTSNLEKAIEFASQHLDAPLALDFRKIFWDVEIGRFSSVKQSLDHYLESWSNYSPEFIESLHLIESSLFEPNEARRVQILEKSLQVILDGVYEKMLRYSREIRSPLTNLYMLGIILPTLGLALLPLASTLLGGAIKAQHIFLIFNIIVPFAVFYMTSNVLLKRPGGHGETSALDKNPLYRTFTDRRPWFIAALIAIPLIFIGLLPFIFQISALTGNLEYQQTHNIFSLKKDYTLNEIGLSFLQNGETKIFDFKKTADSTTGPFGPLALFLSLFIPLGVALFFTTAYGMKTSQLIKSRNDTRELESEFTNSLFQLGNRLGDGIPAEIAFSKVASTTQGQRTHEFFSLVNQNIQQQGMSIDDALFHPQRGALIFFPSALIATSMRILSESAKKGLQVAARSLMSISDYVKNIQRINERLRDLLAEIVSDMRSNMTFLAPLLAGIVVGLASMITSILNKLSLLSSLSGENIPGFENAGQLLQLFDVTAMIPPYHLQISIGIYIVEIVFILTAALVTVDAGRDPLREKHELAKNLKRSMFLYLITAAVAMLALYLLAGVALGNISA